VTAGLTINPAMTPAVATRLESVDMRTSSL
jgi:hypothetical protein